MTQNLKHDSFYTLEALDEDEFGLPSHGETEPVTPCDVIGCELDGTACFYPDNETDLPNNWYCPTHAPQHGFCWGCGLFWGGCESFDFAAARGGIQGLCPNCTDAVRDEFSFGDDVEEGWEDDGQAGDYE